MVQNNTITGLPIVNARSGLELREIKKIIKSATEKCPIEFIGLCAPLASKDIC